MYGVEVLETGALKAFLDFGDNFPLSITCYDDEELSIPSNLAGKAYILGIETIGKTPVSVCEIPGVVVGNVITFPIYDEAYTGKAVEGVTYNFDYWETTIRLTEIPLSTIQFRTVAHKTTEV